MKRFFDVILAWFKKQPTKIEQPSIRAARKPRHLPIVSQRQQYDFSCVPSVLQMTFQFFSGKRLSHEKAIQLTNCDQDGAFLDTVPEIMKRLAGTPSKPLKSASAIRRIITHGGLVVSHDVLTYGCDHAILICGATAKGVYVSDPANGLIRWRSSSWLNSVASEFYAVLPPPPRPCPVEANRK